jgi:hypothetical protein
MANEEEKELVAALDLLEERASEMAGAQGGRAETELYGLEVKLAAARLRLALRPEGGPVDGTRVPSEPRPRRNNGKVLKSPGRSGRKARSEKGPRKCGKCNAAGHNARTCPAAVVAES